MSYCSRSTIDLIVAEVRRARAKFPSNTLLTVALGEEFGELCKAELQGRPIAEIRAEAVQCAALCIRIIEEGDATLQGLSEEQTQR